MKIKKFDELLSNYNSKLNKISKTDIDYKIKINYAVLIFFEEVNKLDSSFIYFFLKNIDKENIKKKQIHKDALNCLVQLIVKNMSTKDLFIRFFPEYLETEFITQSNWRIVRWLQIFISWIFKPKPKLCNSIEAKRILNACRDIKACVSNKHNDLFKFNSEIEDNNALSFVIEKLLENKIKSLIYNPINEEHLFASWEESYKNKILKNRKDIVEIDNLLEYLNCRIKFLSNLDEKKILLEEVSSLKILLHDEKFLFLSEKIKEIMKKIKNRFMPQDAVKILGIYNLFEGINQRLKCIIEVRANANLDHQRCLMPNFKELLHSKIDKIQFYYEYYKENIDKQCLVKNADFDNKLNRFEKHLYTNINLFNHSSNQTFGLFTLLPLGLLQMYAKDLEDGTKDITSVLLKNDTSKLSQFVYNEVSVLQNAFEDEKNSIQNESTEDTVIFDVTQTYEEIDDSDSEWDSDGSDISETLSLNIMQQAQDLGEESPSINLGYQSHSGISEHEVQNTAEQSRILPYDSKSAFFVTALSNEAINSGIVRNYFRNSYG